MLIRKRVKKERETCTGCYYHGKPCYALDFDTPCVVIDSLERWQLFIFVKKEEKK